MKKILVILFPIFLVLLSAASSVAYDLDGLDIHGVISEGYVVSDKTDFVQDSEDISFPYGEIGLNFARNLNDDLRFGIQFFANQFEDLNKNEVLIDWAYVD